MESTHRPEPVGRRTASVIAERLLDLDGLQDAVEIVIYAPLSSGSTYSCVYTISGLSAPHRGTGIGPHSLAAAISAIRSASKCIYESSEYRSGRLRFAGNRELWLAIYK